jgi:hypothetical protein
VGGRLLLFSKVWKQRWWRRGEGGRGKVLDELRRYCIRLSRMAGIHRLVSAYLQLH